MGLFSNFSENKLKHRLQRLVIEKICLKTIDDLLFLGEGEYEHVLSIYKSYANKFHLVPFGVDTDFGKMNQSMFKPAKNTYFLLVMI